MCGTQRHHVAAPDSAVCLKTRFRRFAHAQNQNRGSSAACNPVYSVLDLSIVIIRLKKTVSRRYAKEKWEARNVRSSSWRENLKCIKSYTSRCPPDSTHPIGRNTQGSEFGPICLPQYGGAYLYRNPRRQTPDGPRRGNVSATHPIQHLCAHPQRPHAHTVTLLEYKYYGT